MRAALSRQLCVGNPRNITDIPSVSRLDLAKNDSLSLASDFYHGLLRGHLLLNFQEVVVGIPIDEFVVRVDTGPQGLLCNKKLEFHFCFRDLLFSEVQHLFCLDALDLL